MNRMKIPVFEATVQRTHIWLKDLVELIGWGDQHMAYLALRAVLHALRYRLLIVVSAKLVAQLPMLIRGIYYEGWVPSHTPFKIHHLEDFLGLVASYMGDDSLIPHAELITKSVFKVMANHLSEGEIGHLKKVLPQAIASFWPL